MSNSIRGDKRRAWLVLGSLSLATALVAPQGCSQPTCGDLRLEEVGISADCGFDADTDVSEAPCIEGERESIECVLSCERQAGCLAIRGEDPLGREKLDACMSYCSEMFVLVVLK
jgi:hypothetical protein